MLLITLILCLLVPPSSNPDDPVLVPVRNLFEGMEKGDSSLVRSAFMKGAAMSSVVVTETGTQIRTGNLDRFVSYIGSPRDNHLVEPIWNIQVQRDGVFAQVWADYALYVDGKFSHCGVDAFQLAEIDGSWKIMAITDTRRTLDCVIPDEVKSKHEK